MLGQGPASLHFSHLSAARQAVHLGHLAVHEDDGKWNTVCAAKLGLFEVFEGPDAVVGGAYDAAGFCKLFA